VLQDLKTRIRRQLGAAHDTVLISSMGRTGSTVVFDAVRHGIGAARVPLQPALGVRLVSSQAWSLDDQTLLPGTVYKTHDFPNHLPDPTPPPRIRAVFCFGQASAAALSVMSCPERYGSDWVVRHLEHLRANGTLEDMRHRDPLRFGEQVEAWFAEDRFPVLRVKYETLWDHPDVLSDFFGCQVQLPVRKERRAKDFDPALVADIERNFADLDLCIAGLPDVSLNTAARG
jgi:hypothetical protein